MPKERYDVPLPAEIQARFREEFPGAPSPRMCRAPGRVNLIGEHTDYNLLPVLPMTIDRDILVAYAPLPGKSVRLVNVTPAYPSAEFSNIPDIPPSPPGAWDNYAKASVQALNQAFAVSEGAGMALLVTGNVPVAAGLSSSTALVVASALAWLDLHGVDLEAFGRARLAQLLAEAEQYTGTRGGGMDHAAILLGATGHACKIDFAPLRIERVPLFPAHRFVVCDSGVRADKSGALRPMYNRGPKCCAIIRAVVERQLQYAWGGDVAVGSLGALWFGPLCLTHDEIEEVFDAAFPNPVTTVAELAETLELSAEELETNWLDGLPAINGGLPLRQMARHQVSEFRRVEAARDALLAQDAEAFGELMNESHRSCAEDYGVSCPELDRLAEAARARGALGARLTGAGFGGCTVNLVPAGECQHFARAMTSWLETTAAPPLLAGRPAAFAVDASGAAGYLGALTGA